MRGGAGADGGKTCAADGGLSDGMLLLSGILPGVAFTAVALAATGGLAIVDVF